MTTIGINGTELFYRDVGTGSPLLLIHGMGGDAEVWGASLDLLAEHYRVIAYDRRGFTRSKHSPVEELATHREDAAALLRALDASPATVLGWSSGGLIALDLAIQNPDLVAALVLVEAPLHAARRPGLRQLRAALGARLLGRLRDEAAGAELFLRWAFRYTSGGTGFDRLDESLQKRMVANGPASMGDLRAGTGEHIRKEEIAALQSPLVCMVGELSDRAFARATDYVSGLVPGARVRRVAGAGHAIHLDRPAEFAAVVKDAGPA